MICPTPDLRPFQNILYTGHFPYFKRYCTFIHCFNLGFLNIKYSLCTLFLMLLAHLNESALLHCIVIIHSHICCSQTFQEAITFVSLFPIRKKYVSDMQQVYINVTKICFIIQALLNTIYPSHRFSFQINPKYGAYKYDQHCLRLSYV